jgi:curved DNA-binding protein CbpA
MTNSNADPVKNHYAILGVLPSADSVVIAAAYRALAKKYHPDKWTGNPREANSRMRELNEAYGVLSDNEKRRKYDEDLKRSPGRGADDSDRSPFWGGKRARQSESEFSKTGSKKQTTPINNSRTRFGRAVAAIAFFGGIVGWHVVFQGQTTSSRNNVSSTYPQTSSWAPQALPARAPQLGSELPPGFELDQVATVPAPSRQRVGPSPNLNFMSQSENRPPLGPEAVSFVVNFFNKWSLLPDAKLMSALALEYADNVEQNGVTKTASDILSEERELLKRWPVRAYSVRLESMTTNCSEKMFECMATGIVDWVVKSPERSISASGNSRFSFYLGKVSPERFVIMRESIVVLSNRVSSL